jgi:hypothetical protein
MRVRTRFVLHESRLTAVASVFEAQRVNKPEVYPTSDEVKNWTIARVLEWAKSVPGILDEDVEQLRVNRITGMFQVPLNDLFLLPEVMSYSPVLKRTFEVLVFLLVPLLSLSKPLKL